MEQNQLTQMIEKQINIAIAEIHGYQGVPVQQIWKVGTYISRPVKYWRSVTPKEIIDELSDASFEGSQVARWLKQPDGKPMILRKQPAGEINNFMTYRDRAITQNFENSEWYNPNGWEFQTSDWPIVEPSLAPFAIYLPNYCDDLNAIWMAVRAGLTEDKQLRSYEVELRKLSPDYPTEATARQRAEALLRSLNRWVEVTA